MHELISLLLSNDENIKYRVSKNILIQSYINPEQFLDLIPYIHSVLISLFHSNELNEGIINILIQSLSKSMLKVPDLINISAVSIIELLHDITKICFHGTNKLKNVNIFLISNILVKRFSFPGQITFNIIKAISEHSTDGFLNNSSLIPILQLNFDDVLQILIKSNPEDLTPFYSPLSSKCLETRTFFISLWAILIKNFKNKFIVMNSLIQYILPIVSEAFSNVSNNYAAKVLLNCISYSDHEFQLNYSKDVIIQIRNMLFFTSRKHSFEDITLKPKNHHLVHLTQVETVEPIGIFSSRQVNSYYLVLIEEAQILMWSKKSFIMIEGGLVHFSEIEKTDLLNRDFEENGLKNIMKISLLPKGEKLFSFKTFEEAIQWNNIFRKNSIK